MRELRNMALALSLAAKLSQLDEQGMSAVGDALDDGRLMAAYLTMQRWRLKDLFNEIRGTLEAAGVDTDDSKAVFILGAALAVPDPSDVADWVGLFSAAVGTMHGVHAALYAVATEPTECRGVVH